MDVLQTIEKTSHLGWHSYYCQSSAQGSLADSFSQAYESMGARHALDEVAVLEILNKNYMLGDRTIFSGLKKTPWMSYWSSEQNAWARHRVPEHGTIREEPKRIADQLFELLCQEIKCYVGQKSKVGILLSGGMDSRIVAGALQQLLSRGELNVERVVAYTWGYEDSRDVVYSKKIAELLGWEWRHFIVGPQDLWQNMIIAGLRGCEYTGLHLHAIPQIADNLEVDVMLAGSYGDSVGRAEYSGKHVSRISPIAERITNIAFLMKSEAFVRAREVIGSDVDAYHRLFPRAESYAENELDYQLHYMRRMLNPCMSLIGERIEMYQAFTHPNVFGYMWSLSPECRNDLPYGHILGRIGNGLQEIPWARTGRKYLDKTGKPDSWKKQHYRYSEHIQEDLFPQIQDRLLSSDHLFRDTMINVHAAKRLLHLIKKYPNNNFDYLERISWLVSFTYFLERYPAVYQGASSGAVDWVCGNVVLPLHYLIKRGARIAKSKLR